MRTVAILPFETCGRTAYWIMSRRDNNGGFLHNFRVLDSYGGADQDITNAYIVYALAEAGRRDIQKELDASIKSAIESKILMYLHW